MDINNDNNEPKATSVAETATDNSAFIRGLIDLAHQSGQKKSSAVFVEQANAVLGTAIKERKVTHAMVYDAMNAFKKFPLESATAAQEVYDAGVKAQKDNAGDYLAQFESSAPSAKNKSLLTSVKVLSSVLNGIAARKGYTNKCLSWGTLVQTDVFKGVAQNLIARFKTDIRPLGNEQLQGKFVYNACEFSDAQAIIASHWNYYLAFMKEIGDTDYIKKGEVIPGTDKKSVGGQHSLKAAQIARIKANADQLAATTKNPFVAGNAKIKTQNLSSEDIAVLLLGATAIDVRVLLQTYDFRRDKIQDVSIDIRKDKIRAMVDIVIAAGGVVTKVADRDLNSGSAYSDVYYLALGIIRASIRHFNAQVYGRKGGADTRTKYLK